MRPSDFKRYRRNKPAYNCCVTNLVTTTTKLFALLSCRWGDVSLKYRLLSFFFFVFFHIRFFSCPLQSIRSTNCIRYEALANQHAITTYFDAIFIWQPRLCHPKKKTQSFLCFVQAVQSCTFCAIFFLQYMQSILYFSKFIVRTNEREHKFFSQSINSLIKCKKWWEKCSIHRTQQD